MPGDKQIETSTEISGYNDHLCWYEAEATGTVELSDEEVQQLMASGELSAGHARAILAVPTEDGRVKLAKKVVEEKLSVRQTENLAPLFSGTTQERAPRVPTPRSYKRAAKLLRTTLNTAVRVRNIRGKNKIEIEFSDEDDLARIVELFESHGLGQGE